MERERVGGYELLQRIGVGGMAEVFRAQARRPGDARKIVCLKRIHPNLCTDPDFVRMFVEEARIALALSHRNVVQAFDVGLVEGQYFLVMEYLRGRDLANLLSASHRRSSPLPLELSLYVVLEVLAGLAYAHSLADDDGHPLHLVHRDINPSNVMITEHGEVKILDFGIAKSAQRGFRTQTGIVKGKIGYMAPEQCRGKEIDSRADIFACGVMLHEMLTGASPFEDGDAIEGRTVVTCDDPELAPLLERSVARDREGRFATAVEMHEALSKVLAARRATPSSISLAAYLRKLFGEPGPRGKAVGGGGEFDRVLAAAVEAPGEPIASADTVLMGGSTEEIEAPAAAVDDAQDHLATKPQSAPLEEPAAPREPGEDTPGGDGAEQVAGAITEVAAPREPDASEPMRTTDVFVPATHRGPRIDRGVALVMVLLVGLTAGVVIALRSAGRSPEAPGPGEAGPRPAAVASGAAAAAPDALATTGADDAAATIEPPLDAAPAAQPATRRQLAKTRPEPGDEPPAPDATDGGLSRQEVARTMSTLQPYLRMCLSRSSEPLSYVNIRVQISGEGRARYEGAAPGPPADVAFCLEKVLGRASFRKTGAPLSVVYPVHVPTLER